MEATTQTPQRALAKYGAAPDGPLPNNKNFQSMAIAFNEVVSGAPS
jgi:hypothetical protein